MTNTVLSVLASAFLRPVICGLLVGGRRRSSNNSDYPTWYPIFSTAIEQVYRNVMPSMHRRLTEKDKRRVCARLFCRPGDRSKRYYIQRFLHHLDTKFTARMKVMKNSAEKKQLREKFIEEIDKLRPLLRSTLTQLKNL